MWSDKYFTPGYYPAVYWTNNGQASEFVGAVVLYLEPRGNHMLKINKIEARWVTGAGGEVEIPAPSMYGYLLKVVTVPSPSSPPALGYDLELIGEDGVDVMGEGAHGLDSVNVEEIYPTLNARMTPVMVCGEQTIKLSNTGGEAAGTAAFYFVESLGGRHVS